MRWISTTPQGDSQSSEPRGRTVLRANPNEAMGFSYSVTDTSVPSADGNRRCTSSKCPCANLSIRDFSCARFLNCFVLGQALKMEHRNCQCNSNM